MKTDLVLAGVAMAGVTWLLVTSILMAAGIWYIGGPIFVLGVGAAVLGSQRYINSGSSE